MSKGKFNSQVNKIEKILQKIFLFEERNHFPSIEIDPSLVRKSTYVENYKYMISNNFYDFLTTDNSIITFIDKNHKYSYLFYECPYDAMSFNDFVEDQSLSSNDYEDQLFFYNIYLDECPLKKFPMSFRYDVDYDAYREGVHPVSHLHIGYNTSIRIAIDKIIYPEHFFYFVLRQHYPNIYEKLLKESDISNLKSSSEKLSNKHFSGKDHYEFYLT